MPTVEDYYDDEAEESLPSSSKPRNLGGQGLRGALLEEINSDDDADAPDPDDMALDDMDMDFDKLADQGRGIFGENTSAPPPSAYDGTGKGKLAVREDPGELRPTAGAGGMPGLNPNTPMGGFMGDMMKLQKAEEDRLERVRQQFGNAKVADPSIYKAWNSVYPLYFDAKVSVADGRRVPRSDALWWPQAQQISKACRTLGLPCVLEVDTTHPADWENPGRVKVQFALNGRFLNPIVKNRTQLYKQLAAQMKQAHPELVYKPRPRPSATSVSEAASSASNSKKQKKSKAAGKKVTVKSGKSAKSSTTAAKAQPAPAVRLPSRPPRPAVVPALDDRLPLHSPVAETGVAVAAIKRDVEAEKEAKKKGITAGAGGAGGDGPGKEEKAPKVKRVVVRGKR